MKTNFKSQSNPSTKALPSQDGAALRAELIAAGVIKPVGWNQPFLPLSGPYAPSTRE